MAINFSDFTFVPCASATGGPRGDGDILVPLAAVTDSDAPPATVGLVFPDGLSVTFTGAGQLFFGEDFVGWSYWEEDASFDSRSDAPCVNLVVLSPDYDAANYPAPGSAYGEANYPGV